jgi:pantoate kinase
MKRESQLRSHLTKILVISALAAATALVPASASASVAETKNGCKYLKASEAKTALGVAVTKSSRQPPGPPDVLVCGYKLAAAGGSVNLWVQKGSTASAGFDAAKRAFSSDVEAITGFGKKAFYVAGGLNTLYVLKGGTLIYVQIVRIPDPDPATTKTQVTALAKIVLGRT